MLDATFSTLDEAATWRDRLAPGDVVIHRFPVQDEEPAEPKDRPCLVIDVLEIAGERYAVLAYGTTSTNRANKGLEIRVSGPAARAAAGLKFPTRFVGARRLMVPLTHSGFVRRRCDDSPVIGRLHRVRARLDAERDIAADRRQERRRRWRTRDDFVVEHRHPRRARAAGKAAS